MGALKQYLDLFNSQRRAIDAGSAGALNAARDLAFEALQGRELPDTGVEGYEKTSIDELFSPDFGVNINRMQLPCDIAAAFKCGVPNVSSLLAVVVNDHFVPSATLLNNLPAGVTVMSLARAARERADEIARHYGTAASLQSPGTALNTLLAQDGVYVHVPAGVKVDRPIQLVNLSSTPVPMLTVRRVLIVLDEGAHLSVLSCDHTMRDSNIALNSQVIEVIAGPHSVFNLCDIEESAAGQSRYSQLYINAMEHSEINVGGMTLHCGTTRNEYRVNILGQRAHCQLAGMAIGSDSQHIDNSSDVTHSAPHATSRQLFKYVLDDQASGAFEGSIVVTPEAPFTEAYQSDRNILASSQARMHTKPQLLIYNDDVKCSHGATTGQLDEHALFYMQTRGIPREQARMMLMQAFMAEVVDTVSVDAIRDRLRYLVERRLAGFDASCSDCQSCK